jgi:triacylglycerol esterase/lipase EstA (alpha/beta hydrolase family)
MRLRTALLLAFLCHMLLACAHNLSPQSQDIGEHAETPSTQAGIPDWANSECKPQTGQAPVVLIHGTFANTRRAFSTLGPLLKEQGFCVFALNYGKQSAIPNVYGTGDMENSVQEVSAFIEQVRKQTGVEKVHLVGHSQGGTLALYYSKVLGGAHKISRLVAVSPSVRGTKMMGAWTPTTPCLACVQQSPDSGFIKRLNAGPINQPGVMLLVLTTENDVVVTPLASQFVDEAQVTNMRLQQLLPGRFATHSGILHDKEAMRWLVDWLR